jgi:hypothetical protein
MEYYEMHDKLTSLIKGRQLIFATISQPRAKSDEVKRVKLKPVEIKGVYHIQFEYQYERVLKHENIELEKVSGKMNDLLQQFRQVQADFNEEKVHIQLSKKFKVLWKSDLVLSKKIANLSHNRKKNYLLDEDSAYPFLVRLGVQTQVGKVKNKSTINFVKLTVLSSLLMIHSTIFRKIARYEFWISVQENHI